MPRRTFHPLLFAATALFVGRPAGAQDGARTVNVDSLLAVAEAAIARGRPWQATVTLRPLTTNRRSRRPKVLLTAARASALWHGWSNVVELLGDPGWQTDGANAEGQALLSRGYLELGRFDEALPPARRALALARDTAKGPLMVTLARLHDRLGRTDSAAVWYLRAVEELPTVADWLRVRAASGLDDSLERAAVYREVELQAAQARIPWSEALALERDGRLLDAAARYDALGDRLTAIRVRMRSADSSSRAVARRDLTGLLGDSGGDVVAAIAIFDREVRDPTDDEELRIARRAAAANLAERATAGFARAGHLTDSDRLAYAGVLGRLGRHREALPLLEGVRSPSLRAPAAYERARTLLRSGQTVAATAALATMAEEYGGDAEWAARALFLRADLVGDRAGDDSARPLFRLAHERYPATTFGRRAGFQAALLAFVAGDFRTAATEFDRLATGAHTEERTASLYWAGKAFERSGDAATARERWQGLMSRDAESYYGALVSRRTGREPWPAPPPGPARRSADTDAALARAALLERLGLDREAALELADFAARASGSTAAMIEAARQLHAAQHYGRSVRLAMRAQRRGARWNRELAELLYPLPFEYVLTGEARAAGIDPLLVAGLIRQESAFDVRARSVADARGLMQVLPSVGAAYARRIGVTDFDPVLLYQPDLNLDFGIEHLAESIDRFARVEHALAAYNAGVDRVTRWLRLPGAADDPEVFVERIPFVETRDYVRRVTRNHAMYQTLYLAPAR